MNTKADDLKAELYPVMWERIPEIFPKMNFSRYRGYWISAKHLDGSESKSKSKDQTYVHFKAPRTACDQNGASTSLIDLYMEQTGKDFAMALRDLCNLCGVTYTLTKEEEEKQQAERTKREQYKAAAEAFAVALWNNAAAASVLDYLHGRGWTDDEIKAAHFGFIDEEIKDQVSGKFEQLKNALPKAAGDSHRLVIPYRHANQIRGFKFRTLTPDQSPKYINSIGLQKGSGLFNLRPYLKDDPDPVVIVEGEFDALRATAKDAINVVATTGGAATEEQIKDATQRGAKCFVLAFDNDEHGRDFTNQTAERIKQAGARAYVAQYPDGIKDADEFFNTYSVSAWNEFIKNPFTLSEWQCLRLLNEYEAKAHGGELTSIQRDDLQEKAVKLLSEAPAEHRARVRELLEAKQSDFSFCLDDLKEKIKEATDKAKKEAKRTEAKKALEEAIGVLQSGSKDPLAVLKKAGTTLNTLTKGDAYAAKFAPPTRAEIYAGINSLSDGIPTGFVFGQGEHKTPLTLNTGLTFVCGSTGHGKTTFLNNLALNEAYRNLKEKTGKRAVYFSYEINRWRLVIDILATIGNNPDLTKAPNPQAAIINHLKGNDGDINPEQLKRLKEAENLLFDVYLQTGALTIVDGEDKAEEMIRALEYYTGRESVSAVFIDYAQLLYSEDYNRLRTEEIKKIVNDLKDFANRANLPIVLAAQFNRQVNSPIDLETRNIGEGGDFERIADTCIGLFNLRMLKPIDKATDEQTKRILQDVGIYTDEIKPLEGKLFVRLLKRRYGYYPLDTVLTWNGKTKRIKRNSNEI